MRELTNQLCKHVTRISEPITVVKVCCHRDLNRGSAACTTAKLTTTPRRLSLHHNDVSQWGIQIQRNLLIKGIAIVLFLEYSMKVIFVVTYLSQQHCYCFCKTHMSETIPHTKDPARLPNMCRDVSRVEVNFRSQTKPNCRTERISMNACPLLSIEYSQVAAKSLWISSAVVILENRKFLRPQSLRFSLWDTLANMYFYISCC